MLEQQNRLCGAHVLVVEDEFLIADDLARALERSGAKLLGPVNNATDARRLIQRRRPDAAILDLNLHGEVATDLIEELSEAKVPCLIVSGYSEESYPEAFKTFRSLEKPVDCRRVTETLASVLETNTHNSSR